jgi:4-hydroxybenzoate polyprenyltransferase
LLASIRALFHHIDAIILRIIMFVITSAFGAFFAINDTTDRAIDWL